MPKLAVTQEQLDEARAGLMPIQRSKPKLGDKNEDSTDRKHADRRRRNRARNNGYRQR